jgi:hypothetical protein
MATSTLLCIHRDKAELNLLRDNGYELVNATSGSEGLRFFMARLKMLLCWSTISACWMEPRLQI